MNERLLQFIWQHQYFNRNELVLPGGEPLRILFPGNYNVHQGPDFLQARMQVGQIMMAGHVELHVKTSDWKKHGHDGDENYQNVILHVVWKHDSDAINNVPVLELANRVSNLLLDQYQLWMQQPSFIPCQNQFAEVGALLRQKWRDQLLRERLLQRTKTIHEFLQQNNQHWEESFWWWLARHFGAKVNTAAFEAIARSIPVNLLAKHKPQIQQLEALLFGQAGLLNRKFTESYPKLLQKEYRFLQKKYNMRQPGFPLYFLRMRPGNFPSIRLAQLAAMIHRTSHLFSTIRETNDVADVRKLFDITANDYWHYHYVFEEPSAYKPKHIGLQMIDTLIINALCPALFAYGYLNKEQLYIDKSLRWLSEIVPEKNAVINGFLKIGVPVYDAGDTQALLELKTHYCDLKKCLDCAIGKALLKNATK